MDNFFINKKNCLNDEINTIKEKPITWIDFNQFIREANLSIISKHKISHRLLVGWYFDKNNSKILSQTMKNNLIFYGNIFWIKYFWILLILMPMLIIILLGFPIRLLRFKLIKRNAYDIEHTFKDYKIIRNIKGKLGLIEWYHCGNCKLCLKPKYDSIKYIEGTNFIVKKDNQYGLYELRNNEWILPCLYDSINIDSSKNVVVLKDNKTEKFNLFGDRML